MVLKKRDDGMVEMVEGITRQTLTHGERTLLVKVFLKEGRSLPLHSHREEQTGYLLSGRMIMTIEGIDHELEEGDSWSIKGNVEHGVKVLSDSVVVEVFSPIRKDFLE